MRAALATIGIDQVIVFYFISGTAAGPFHHYGISNLNEIILGPIPAAGVIAILSLRYGVTVLAAVTPGMNPAQHIVEWRY
jgi:hypothetical protein